MTRSPQGIRTATFRADADGWRQVSLAHTGRSGERGYISAIGGRGGYVWIGSEEKGCFGYLPLTTLKRLVDQATRAGKSRRGAK